MYQNTRSKNMFFQSPRKSLSYSNRKNYYNYGSTYQEGTYHTSYQTTNIEKNYKQYTTECILFMPQYENSSLFERRCQDYMINFEQKEDYRSNFRQMLQRAKQYQHLYLLKGFQDIQQNYDRNRSTFGNRSPQRDNRYFSNQRENSFGREQGRDSQNQFFQNKSSFQWGDQKQNDWFNNNQERYKTNNSKQNSFFKRDENFGGNNSFFSRSNQQAHQQDQNQTNFFNSNQKNNSSFFGTQQQNRYQNNQQSTQNSFFNQNQSKSFFQGNKTQNNTNTGFFQSQQNSFFGNKNQSQSFFNSNNSSSFFNQGQQQNKFFNQQQGNSFFNQQNTQQLVQQVPQTPSGTISPFQIIPLPVNLEETEKIMKSFEKEVENMTNYDPVHEYSYQYLYENCQKPLLKQSNQIINKNIMREYQKVLEKVEKQQKQKIPSKNIIITPQVNVLESQNVQAQRILCKIEINYQYKKLFIEPFFIQKKIKIKQLKEMIINQMPQDVKLEELQNQKIFVNLIETQDEDIIENIIPQEAKEVNVLLKFDEFYHKQKMEKENTFEICSQEKLPILTKAGYKTIPDMKRIARMTEEELENLSYFKIYNEMGSIEWFEHVNILEQNLDVNVLIGQFKIEVYPDHLYFGEYQKPKIGEKLNKECLVTLNHFQKPENLSHEEYIYKLKEGCQKQQAEFIHYDEEKQFFQFKVFHFTLYSFLVENTDEGEENENQQEQNKKDSISYLIKDESISQRDNEDELSKIIDQYEHSQSRLMTFKKKTRFQEEMNSLQDFPHNISHIQPNRTFIEETIHQEKPKEDIQHKITHYEDLFRQIAHQESSKKFILNKKIEDSKTIKNFRLLNTVINKQKLEHQNLYEQRQQIIPMEFYKWNQILTVQKGNNFQQLVEFTLQEYKITKNSGTETLMLLQKQILQMMKCYQKNSKLDLLQQEEIFLNQIFSDMQSDFLDQNLVFPYLVFNLIQILFSNMMIKNGFKSSTEPGQRMEEFINEFKNHQQDNHLKRQLYLQRMLSVWCQYVMKYIIELSKPLNSDPVETRFSLISQNKSKPEENNSKSLSSFFITKFYDKLCSEPSLKVVGVFQQIKSQYNSDKAEWIEEIFFNLMNIFTNIENKENLLDKIEFIPCFKILESNKEWNVVYLLLHKLLIFREFELTKNEKFKKQYIWNLSQVEECLFQNTYYFLYTFCLYQFGDKHLVNKNELMNGVFHKLLLSDSFPSIHQKSEMKKIFNSEKMNQMKYLFNYRKKNSKENLRKLIHYDYATGYQIYREETLIYTLKDIELITPENLSLLNQTIQSHSLNSNVSQFDKLLMDYIELIDNMNKFGLKCEYKNIIKFLEEFSQISQSVQNENNLELLRKMYSYLLVRILQDQQFISERNVTIESISQFYQKGRVLLNKHVIRELVNFIDQQ